jgi:hypothetical protein
VKTPGAPFGTFGSISMVADYPDGVSVEQDSVTRSRKVLRRDTRSGLLQLTYQDCC